LIDRALQLASKALPPKIAAVTNHVASAASIAAQFSQNLTQSVVVSAMGIFGNILGRKAAQAVSAWVAPRPN
jgi:hypothetical protein